MLNTGKVATLFKYLVFGLTGIVIVLFFLILIGFAAEYFHLWQTSPLVSFIGINEYKDTSVNFLSPPKTLWDLFGVIIIPVVVALGVGYLQNSQKEREFILEDERSQDAKYREYLKTMESLILDRSLLKSPPPTSVCSLAQAYTRDVIKSLTGPRLGMLLDFLESYEFNLIVSENPTISLQNLMFKNADLTGLKLDDISLENVIMNNSKWNNVTCSLLSASNAQFENAHFENASFGYCDFSNANFTGAVLKNATFRNCDLSGAIFNRADLTGAIFPLSDVSFVQFDKQTRIDYKWRIVFETILNLQPRPLLKAEDLVDTVLAGADLKGFDLSDADLTNADLTGVDLRQSNLTNVRLNRANLTFIRLDDQTRIEDRWRQVATIMSSEKIGQHLEYVDLSNAFLEYASLEGAKLRSAILVGSDLNYANLRNADLRGANLASFIEAENNSSILGDQDAKRQLFGKKLNRFLKRKIPSFWSRWFSRFYTIEHHDAFGEQTTLLLYADLTNADLRGAQLSNVQMGGTKLHKAKIDKDTVMDEKWKKVYQIVNSKVDLKTLAESELSSADLSSIDLTNAVLDKSDMTGANLSGTLLVEASLFDVDLDEADLSGSNLTQADLRKASLTGAILQGAVLKNAQLQGANLSGADLEDTDLSGANLTDAIIQNVNFHLTNLVGTTMPDGRIKS